MPLPPKLFYSICETATRWSVSPIDIVGWAIDGRITLSAALPLVEAKQGRPVEGLVEISGQDVFDLFDAGTNKKSPSAFSGSGVNLAHGGRRSSRQMTASRSSRQVSSSRAPKSNASSASMECLGTTQRMINKRRKPARDRSASPAHRPVTTGMPSPAPSHGGFTMEACPRARANWSATCSSGSPRRVGFRIRAQSAGACRHCGRC